MNPLVRVQIENNATTASAWASFAAHRNRVTGLLQARSAASRLCVLGAGNCNDFDIGELLASHAEIHLVDLDPNALSGGIARQNVNAHRSIHTHAPFDLSGRLEAMASWRPSAPVADADVERCIRCATEVASELPGPFQLTASNCVLSQLIDAMTDAIGASHPRFADLVAAVRLGHLRLMASLTSPGGAAVLITDVVSSDTCPELQAATDWDLPGLLAQVVGARNFFHGTSPTVLAAVLHSDAILRSCFLPPEWIRPWVWNLGPRLYLVHAVVLRRRPATQTSASGPRASVDVGRMS